MTEFQLHETDDFTATDVGDDVAWPPALTPYISVRGARQAIDWYTEVFAARLRGGLYEGPDGSIGHAELAIGDAVLMLSDPWLEGGVDAPEPGHTHSHSLHLQVDDVDGTVRRAADEGAVVERPAGGRAVRPGRHAAGSVRASLDAQPATTIGLARRPRRHRLRHVVGARRRAGQGVLRRRTRLAVLTGQRPAGVEHRRSDADDGSARRAGEAGWGDAVLPRRRTWQTAIERVRHAGGEADDPQSQPYGLLAYCTDDQGIQFQLWQPTD